ncbi:MULTISPECIES: restriction endonuclease subunit S [Xanthomonas]|uniref:Restriction endonuclease subunit S n=1 Tax=Xanthomonas cucurbitae TaxID=56453 RepID=A0ABY7Y9Y4_9XANT|nr:restriction endonuclease subunit S [Xanthomonas cucurbitae]QHG87802.1 restriction endonuclease subunit S [Xanthomonas cucurbitae]WDM66674.1 restriction endonuclease subunit S [Xanthomonas cucurbitae]WDM70551.1 restriction endonuclease subunit S [Xanthomonas cucurbitae]WDM74420.1 restriction endonuclease subunit S [Xanthomonas cucurbitae]
MLPKDWRRSTIGESTKLISGNTPSKENPAFWSGDFPWVTVRDMKTPWLQETGLTLTESGKSAASIAPANSVLVVTRGMALLKDLPISLTMRDMAFNQDIKAMVPVDDLDARFFAYQLQSKKHIVLDMVDTAGHGTGKLDTILLKSVDLALPPIREQRRIAHILSTWDQAIVTVEKLLKNSQNQKSALMCELLSRRKEGEDWKAYQLGDLFTERIEGKQDSLPLLSITRDDGIVLRDSVGRKDTSNEDKSKYLRICPGDIGYNTMRMWQGVSALSQIEGIVSPAYTIILPNEKIDARFAAYLFKLEEMIFTFYRHSQGLVSDTWNLKFEHFKKIKVRIPMLAEQERAVRVLTAADDLINAHKAQIKKLRSEKTALMAQLLTGKRRVRLPAEETSAA